MRKRRRIAIAAVLGIAFLICVIGLWRRSGPGQNRFKLPAGPITPSVKLGASHGLVLAPDGSLWSWGSRALGWPVLGLGNVTNQFPLRRIGNDTNWISISAAHSHNLAVKSDGTLWAWGANIRGQLGDGTVLMRAAPVRSAPGNDWKQAAVGGSHSLGLKTDGTLWAWGNNWCGQLGIGSTSNSLVATRIGSATNWIRIWAGLLQSVGQQSDGSLWVWGDNPAFPMGTNSLLVPTRFSSDTNWVDVCFGNWTTFVLRADGTLWVWGRTAKLYEEPRDKMLDAAYARAGGGTNWTSDFWEIHASATPVRVGTNADWQAIAGSGWWYTILMKRDGSLWVLDATEYDDIGKPPAQYQPIRTRRIPSPKNIVAFSAGNVIGGYSAPDRPIGVALTRNGEVWTWGHALGEETSNPLVRVLANAARWLHVSNQWDDPKPIVRRDPWLLPNLDPGASASK